jgi:hypothetical protein
MDNLVSFPPVITLHLQSKIRKLVKMI